MYIHNSVMSTEIDQEGHEIFAKTIDFAKHVRDMLLSHKLQADSWETLYAKGQLRVGFGTALDVDWRNKIFRDAGRSIDEEVKSDDPEEDHNTSMEDPVSLKTVFQSQFQSL